MDTSEAEEYYSKHTSFTELLLTPNEKNKTAVIVKPSMKSRGMILTKKLFVDKRDLNHLTHLQVSHTGSGHALCDLFRAYFIARESPSQQPTMYNLF